MEAEGGQAPAPGQPVQQEGVELPPVHAAVQHALSQARTEVVQQGGVVRQQAGGQEQARTAAAPTAIDGSSVGRSTTAHLLTACSDNAETLILCTV